MTISEAREALKNYQKAMYGLGHAMSVLYVDGDTAAPKESWRGRGEAMGYLSSLIYDLTADPRNEEMLKTIRQNPDGFTPEENRIAELITEDLQDMQLFSQEEYVARQKLLTEAGAVWHEAKVKSDYAAFAPYLEKLIAFQRRFAALKAPDRNPYDVLLDTYEKGMSTKILDPFFDLLKTKLTPVIHAVAESEQPRTDFLHRHYPAALQDVFSHRLMDLIGLPADRCTLGTTEHPFTDGMNKWDVRITTHYHEDDVSASMYSVIHEGGHALYELGVADAYQFTRLAGGNSMSIHESQSRFYENLIGRSYAFSEVVLPIVREIFPEQTKDVTAEDWYRAVNQSSPSLIRTEADELTYPMHVLLRYELEKQLIGGTLSVKDLPAAWNEGMKKYLGVTVPDDRRGVLQDSHWSGGSFGYFPSYALGSAYGVQMLENMNRDFSVDDCVRKGDLTPVTAWLGTHIHRHGQMLTPQQVLESAGVSPFEPQKYVDYLTDKYRTLYHL
ncbi:MAG: carboxypeptidase M32 [Clostridia bacterium]|nr:carboxypeptidase M32 [Clostridia bacterium]